MGSSSGAEDIHLVGGLQVARHALIDAIAKETRSGERTLECAYIAAIFEHEILAASGVGHNFVCHIVGGVATNGIERIDAIGGDGGDIGNPASVAATHIGSHALGHGLIVAHKIPYTHRAETVGGVKVVSAKCVRHLVAKHTGVDSLRLALGITVSGIKHNEIAIHRLSFDRSLFPAHHVLVWPQNAIPAVSLGISAEHHGEVVDGEESDVVIREHRSEIFTGTLNQPLLGKRAAEVATGVAVGVAVAFRAERIAHKLVLIRDNNSGAGLGGEK